MTVLFFEDPFYKNFEPLSISHPVYMLLWGTSKIYEKWLGALNCDKYGFLARPFLADILNLETGKETNRIPDDDFLLVNGRSLPLSQLISRLKDLGPNEALVCDDILVAYRGGVDSGNLIKNELINIHTVDGQKKIISLSQVRKIKTEFLSYLWNLVETNGQKITEEFARFKGNPENGAFKFQNGFTVSRDNIYVHESVEILPSAVIDASGGPVIIEKMTKVEPFSYIQGPCYIGPDCRISGGKIRAGTSLGPVCRVGGEVEETIMLGYCNKYHEGFLGHAYLGEWVNLGALTTNSDLKNNYKEISVELGGKAIKTGSMKIGCFVGDHTKTGIGTMLNTGINIGFSCNLYGGLFAGKAIPSFSWGTPDNLVKYRLEKAIETAEISMDRRGVEFTSRHENLFGDIYNSP